MADKTQKTKTENSKIKRVPKEKIESVKKLAEEIKNRKAVMLVSIKGIPSAQLQKIKKDLRGKAVVRVAKKSILLRALDTSEIKEIEGLKNYVQENCAILISDENPFEITAWLAENKNPIAAKEGQIAENDIIVEEGPTELVPGPVISELGSLGLQIMVEEGKITIRKSKVVVKKGERISEMAASVLQKLGIKPFMIGITPIAFYDATAKKVYVGIKIDKKKALEDLINSHSKALGFAVAISYPSKSTIRFLLAKAKAHYNALSKLETKTQT